MPPHILHVSHSFAGEIGKSGLPCAANNLEWLDLLSAGPVAALPLKELTALRMDYLHRKGSFIKTGELPARDEGILQFREYDEICLWFGPLVEEQLCLLQVLDALAEQDMAEVRVTHPNGDPCWFDKLEPAWNDRQSVSMLLLNRSREAWRLFCGSDPELLFEFAKKHEESFPCISAAFLILLQELPRTRDGLSAIEATLLESIAGDSRLDFAMAKAAVWHDWNWFRFPLVADLARNLLDGPAPLIALLEQGEWDRTTFRSLAQRRVRLTEAGRAVIAGEADAIQLRGIDRWIGGLHLRGTAVPWRWDKEEGKPVR